MIEIYASKIVELRPELLEQLMNNVSDEKRLRINQLVRKEDIYRTLIADILDRCFWFFRCCSPDHYVRQPDNRRKKGFGGQEP